MDASLGRSLLGCGAKRPCVDPRDQVEDIAEPVSHDKAPVIEPADCEVGRAGLCDADAPLRVTTNDEREDIASANRFPAACRPRRVPFETESEEFEFVRRKLLVDHNVTTGTPEIIAHCTW